MSIKNQVVFGLYKNREEAEKAVDTLKTDGFSSADVSILFPKSDSFSEVEQSTRKNSSEGGAAGGTTGILVGGALGWLVGVGALAIPGLGPLIAAGPIVAALAGAGVGGTVGGVSGALIGLGIRENEASRYENYVKSGGILLSVHVDDLELAANAKHILEVTGAKDISSSSVAEEKKSFSKPFKSGSKEYVPNKLL